MTGISEAFKPRIDVIKPTETISGIPDRALFVDFNRTLLHPDGKLSAGSKEALEKALQHARTEGITVIPNSDSPLPQLWRMWRQLDPTDRDPTILAENGLLFYTQGVAYPLRTIPDVSNLQRNLSLSLAGQGLNIFPPIVSPEFEEQNEVAGPEGARGIAFGKNRICNMTMFGLRREGDTYQVDKESSDAAVEILKTHSLQDAQLYYDPRPAYIAIHPLFPGETSYKMNKARGIEMLADANPNMRAGTIGDDERDIIYGVNDRMFSSLVANASDEHKAAATFISEREYTWGTIDLIYQGIERLK